MSIRVLLMDNNETARGLRTILEQQHDIEVVGMIGNPEGHDGSAVSDLTARQREVLQLLAEGLSNKEVAASLSISVKTVEAHRAQIMEKLGIRSVAGLTKFAIREGLTSLDA